MIKTMKMIEARIFCENFLQGWEQDKANIKLTGKSLYDLVGLKKECEKVITQLQETISLIAETNHGELREDGSFFFAEEYREKANEAFENFSSEEVEIDYSPIILTSESIVPASLMDIIYEFSEFKN